MDVRQFAFLARQPSAVVKSRSHFLGLPKRGLALILANAMFWQPLLAQAEGIVVSAPGTTLGQAGNGVPIVNIAAPNGSGLSHNQFQDYNVGANGVILNNATGRTQSTQLGGIIVGNPNFNGNAANVILNEVNGGSPSQLRGYTEVAGQSAHVIVANPYGISCNGCGFINTPQATLTTGKAVIENGQISRYQVDQGSVAIDGTGLNASNVDQFEIITRATTLNAQIQAKKLTIVTGRNDVDARTLNATARASDGSKAPDLAIDSSALGGMYVGAVKLVGTEAGVGVKLSGDMVAGGDIRIDAAGNVVMSQTSAGAALAVKTANLEAKGAVYAGTDLSVKTQGALTNQQALAAKDSITLDAGGRLTNNGIIEAGVNADNSRNSQGDVHLEAQAMDNTGKTVIASRDLSVQTGEFTNQGGTLSAQRNAQLTATNVDNQNQGRILSAGSLGITADQLLNSQGGLITGTGNLTAGIGQLINRNGELSSQAQVTLQLAYLDNVAGLVSAGQSLSLNASGLINNQGGRISGRQAVQITAGSLNTSQKGSLTSQGNLDLKASAVDNSASGQIASAQGMTADLRSLDQHDGGHLVGSTGLTLDLNRGQLDNRNGLINTRGQLTLNNINAVDNRQGEISSTRSFVLAASSLDNGSGKVLSDQGLALHIAGLLENGRGLVSATSLDAVTGDLNNQSGKFSARNSLNFTVTGLLDNTNGELLAKDLALTTGGLNNSNARVQGDRTLAINSGALANQHGILAAGNSLTLNATNVDNSAGQLTSDGVLTAAIAGNLLNQTGLLAAQGDLHLNLGSLDNQQGKLFAQNNLDLHVDGALSNRRGTLRGDTRLDLKAGQVDNSEGGRISANQSLKANVVSLAQHNDGRLFSQGDVSLDLNYGQLNNQGGVINAAGQLLLANLGNVDNQGGEISSSQAFTLAADTLNNRNAKLLSEQALTVRIARALDNAQGLVSANTLDIRAGSLDNQGGVLSAGDGLITQIYGALDNRNGKVLARTASVNSASLDNRLGLLQGDTAITLNSLGLIDNRQGTLVAAQSIDLTAAGLDNNAGKLTSDGLLTARIAGQLLNQNGLFSAGSVLQVSAASLDNSAKGNLYGKGHLGVMLATSLNNDQGALYSDGTLAMSAGQVDNGNGGRITSQQQLTVSVTGLDQHNGGGLYSQSGVSLDLNHGHLNNQGGLIQAPGALLLNNLASVNNQGGEISSDQALRFTADSFDNQSGKLLSEQGLIVRIARALDNTKGLINANALDVSANSLLNAEGALKARDELVAQVGTTLDNHQGEILGARMRLASAVLDNSGGLIQSDKTLTLNNTGALTNHNGRMISGQALYLSSGSLDNQAKGNIAGNNDLTLSIGQFDNRGGRVTAAGALLANGDQLDNGGGGLLNSGKAMSLQFDRLDNQGGEASSVTDLSLTSGQFDNSRGGRLLANGAVQLTLDHLNNQQGTVRGGGSLRLQAATLNNNGGRISSGAAQQLTTTGALSNRNGELLSAMALTLNSASFDNQGGKLMGDGAVSISTGTLNNQNSGRLTSADRLDLTAGQVDNRFDGTIASNKTLTASINDLDQRGGGELYSSSDLTLNMNQGILNNSGGLIHAPGQLRLKNLSAVSNQNGEVSSGHAFTLAAKSFDNSNGKVLSDQALSLKIDLALINLKGVISAAGITTQAARLDNSSGVFSSSKDVVLTLGADLLNDDGEVSSSGASVVNAMTLNNRNGGKVMGDISLDLTTTGALFNQGGTLGSGQRLNVTSASLDNSQSGSLVSDGRLTVEVNGLLDNQAKGAVLAKGVMDIQAGSVDNRTGRLSGQNLLTLRSASLDNRGGAVRANQNLNLHIGKIDNREGVLNSKQALAIAGQSLNNQGGLASAIGPVRLTLDNVNNAKGRIASQDDLEAIVGVLNQQGGELVALGNLTLNGDTLDNSDKGQIAATKALKLKVSNLDNRAGEISSQQNMDLSGQRLDNSGGKLLAGTALELAMDEVINQAKGLVFAQSTRFTGARLNNADGTFGAKHSLAMQLSAGLDNTRGNLTSEGSMDLIVQRLDNTGGSLSGAGPLTLSSATDVLNTGGILESAQGLKLTSASLDNTNGLLKSQGTTTLTTGVFTNGFGARVTSADSLDLTATQVTNSGHIGSVGSLSANFTGLTQRGGAELVSTTQLTLDLHNGELVNAGVINAPLLALNNLASIDNQNGEISSQNAFTLAAKNLDNSNGKLISNQALTLRVDQVLANVKGHINAAGLDARSTRLNNTEGLLSGRGDVNISATELLDNQRGSVIADGALLLTGGALDNRNGEIAGKAQVTATTASIDNQNGKLISTEGLHLRGARLDNRNGLVGATKALKLDVDMIDNRDGELTGNADVAVTGQQLNNSDKGVVYADGGLSLTVDQIINRTLGEMSGQRLALTGTSLDNNGGKLLSQQPLMLELAGDLDNSQGVLGSEDTLSIKARSLNNSEGSLSSAQGLNIAVTEILNNHSGKLVSDGNLTLRSASIGNEQGTISGKGPVSVITGVMNNQGGRLNSGDTLTLTTGQLNNGGNIGGEKGVTSSVTGLDQQGGKLFSNAGLSLDLNNGVLNNTGGLLNAKGPLLLNNLNTVTNQHGEISSGQAFTLAAQRLDNSDGKLLSNQDLTLRVNQALNNIKGLIGAASLNAHAAALDNRGGTLSSRSDLQLSSDGLLRNTEQGLINAAQTLTIQSGDLNNQNGNVLGAAVSLNAMALDNTVGGLINSKGSLNLTAASLNTGSGGEVSAKGALGIDVNALAVAGGRIVGDQGVNLDLNNSDLDNRNGLLLANGPLVLKNLRDLNNQGGEISSQQSFSLTARSLDNTSGKLISSQTLTLNAGSLLNTANGLMSGWQGLNVSGESLDNGHQGTLSSRNGAVDVRLTGALLNNAEGALVSQDRLDVSAASLDNRDKGVLSSAAGQSLRVSGLLSNANGGLIDSGAALDMQATTLANISGTINAQQALSFTGTDLINNGGTLVSNGQLTLDLLGNLNNGGGKLASFGPLSLRRANQVYNDADGQIASQGLLTLFAGGLNNSERGTIAGKERVAITTIGVLQNQADGLIYSQTADVQLSAASLNNVKGMVQGQNGLNLDISGDIDNQGGKLLAQTGDTRLKASTLDNRGGTLASLKGLLDAKVTGVLRNGYGQTNQGGIAQGHGLNLTAASLDNQGGRIAALAGDTVVNADYFANANGAVFAKGLLRVSGQNLDNSVGQMAGGAIDLGVSGALANRSGVIESDTTLSVAADSVDNQGGKLRALGRESKTLFQIGNLFDNRNGVVETANTDLTLAANNFQNSGGQLLHVGEGNFDISLPNVTGAGGSIVTRGGLTLNADTWTNSSVIQAGRLNVNVNNFTQTQTGQLLASKRLEGKGGNWTNNGVIASDGSLALQLTSDYQGDGRVSSVGALDVSAAQMTLNEPASMAGGGLTNVTVAGQLTNRGRLTSNSGMTINTGGVSNFGTVASAQNLLINAQTLTNERIRANEGSLLLSGGDMKLQVGTLANTYSDIYSLGGVEVGGYNGVERAARVDNLSGRIESTGDMSLKAAVVANKMESFNVKATNAVSASIGVRCLDCSYVGQNGVFTSHLVWQQNFNVEATGEQVTASLVSGKNLSVLGDKFENFNSTVSAVSDINIAVNDFNNTASAMGGYQSLKYIQMYPSVGLWGQIFHYNATNDSTYNRNIHFWNAAEQESIVGLKQPTYRNQTIATYNLNFGPKGGQGASVPKANFIPGVTVQAPAEILNATPFAEKIIASPGASFVPAVIQAGGNVSINAANKITNGVERSFSTTVAGSSRDINTQISGTGNSTIINLNRQLPPDLAQQKVDPLTLAGFSLPSGKNGLFRLSEQGVSTQQAGPARPEVQSWTMGATEIGLAQRQQVMPEKQGRTIQFDGASLITASTRQVTVAAREASNVNANSLAVNVSDVANADTGTGLPGRASDWGIVQIGAISVGTSSGIPAVSASQISDLIPEDRDPRIAITAPGSSPSQHPELSVPVDRTTRVDGSQHDVIAPDLNIPGVTPLAALAVVGVAAVDQPVGEGPSPVSRQTITRVEGLPSSKAASQPHKYLVETNPVLTDLRPFMSSDYLLAGLGYNPDESAKRLGDGLYEQRLIQQAIVERTGQRFIDGQTSDEAVFRYLMDNAIRSKQALGLSVGVSLTGQQVAALTHDIVWLEEHVVNGEKVLVPVLYLAQADGRLAPNGALIAGQDVNLIAGKDLENAGTLRASNNLTAVAGSDLINRGLIEAGNRLDLLAGNNIVNKSGGIIAGRDVSMTTINGDVINERTTTGAGYNIGFSKHNDYIDSAARIEAVSDLSIRAGRDVTSKGGVLQSGNDTTIVAGRDVNLIAAQQHDTMNGGKRNRSEEITQSGSSVETGRDLKVTAGRDFTAIASEIEAKRDVSMSTGGDIYLASGADEQHSYSKTSSTKRQEDHVSQISTSVTAGRDVTLSAGKDLALIASRISSGDEAYLVAGNNLGILSAEDSDYSLYDMKRGGGFGSGKTQRDEVTDVKNIGSQIKSGGDLTIQSQGDQKYQVARLESGEDLTIVSGGAVTFEGMKDLHQESHAKSKSSFAWNTMSGAGNTDETFKQTQMSAKGSIVIKAVDGLNIDVKHVNQQTVSQAIDAMVKADPQLAWLKEAEKRGDVDWRKVQEIHESFKYNNSSLGGGAALVIAIIVTYFTWGLGAELVGAAATSTTGLAASAVYTGVAVKTATSAINNKGDLGEIAKDVTSSDSLKGYAIAGLSGPIAKLFGVTGAFTAADLGRQLAVNSALKTVVNGGSFTRNVGQAALDLSASLLSGMIYEQVGAKLVGSELSTKVAVHAIVGGLIAEAAGGDFASGAIAAGANKALVQAFGDDLFPGAAHERLLAMTSQLIGMTVAAGLGGSAKDQEVAGWVAQQGTVYNYLEHSQQEALAKQIDATCERRVSCILEKLDEWKPLADKQNLFTPAEQAQYDQAQQILTDKLLENCDSDFCSIYTVINMKQAGLKCGDISCLRESAWTAQKEQYIRQRQWGKLILEALGDGGAIAGALAPVLTGGSKVLSGAGNAVDDAAAIAKGSGSNLGLADTLLPDADFIGRGIVRTDLADHLVNAAISGKQISGGHNLENFMQALKDASGTISGKPLEVAPGIYKVEYKLPNATKDAVKTVYDPKVYPEMSDMASDAARRALIQYQATGERLQEVIVGKLRFQVPINIKDGEMYVPTAFPIGVVK
ncbi:filamentous hemagglutinin N-terminal domain-containing protein [Pseudomonas sp. lyk4-R2A-8]|uniref:two-partner secretion domain-containing protein n=1 Tax=Pseudomonas sp. lyk4-R2A-8 TaxID=3040316 RepID=UPI002557A521|nr:filamentous hemagglutinin N-terminal domain-containing protein [Pseudomonas sp. lyk4-R2A-8]